MYELQRLRIDHEAAILDFERANREYFAQSISDRGDDYFEHFEERHRAMLTEQDAGRGAFYVLVDNAGTVDGRFNLYQIADGTANVGYRVAQRVAGRGVADIRPPRPLPHRRGRSPPAGAQGGGQQQRERCL